MLYDCFLYNGESDILKLRLETLAAVVDRIIIVEAVVTFSGQAKKLTFNPADWAAHRHKITYIVVSDTPNSDDRWDREYFQRNAILRGLGNCNADDLIIISDVDEIPDPTMLQQRKRGGYRCQISNYWLDTVEDSLWVGPVVSYYFMVAIHGPQQIRNNRYNYQRVDPGGWHFTYISPPHKIIEKLQSFSHKEYDTPEGHKLVLEARERCQSFVSKKDCRSVDIISGYFPQYLKDHLTDFQHLLKT
jgi:hypothetical protein